MKQVLLLALLVVLVYLVKALLFPRHRSSPVTPEERHTAVTEDMVQDPLCRTYLPQSQAIRRHIHGREHFFCSPGCVEKFLALHS
jgi:YHS domain-containing protein